MQKTDKDECFQQCINNSHKSQLTLSYWGIFFFKYFHTEYSESIQATGVTLTPSMSPTSSARPCSAHIEQLADQKNTNKRGVGPSKFAIVMLSSSSIDLVVCQVLQKNHKVRLCFLFEVFAVGGIFGSGRNGEVWGVGVDFCLVLSQDRY